MTSASGVMSSPSTRLQLMQKDVAAVICACRGYPGCPFQEFTFDDNMFALTYVDPSGKQPPRQASFSFSEDYPEQTVVTWANEPNDPTISDERVQVLFNQIAQDLSADVHITMSQSVSSELGTGDNLTVARTLSNTPSYYSDCQSDVTSDEYDNEDYYQNDTWESDEEDTTIQPLLQQEIEIVRANFGEKSISHRLFGAIDDIDVELHIEMPFLDGEIAKAWKVIRDEPIVVRIHLSLSRYLDATEPKVEVFQPSQKENFGVGSQLRKILEQFISDTWRNITNDLVEAKLAKSARPRKVGSSIGKKRFPSQVANIFGSMTEKLRCLVKSNSEPEVRIAETEQKAFAAEAESMCVITEMGFTEEMGHNALIITHGNLEEALNLLITSPESLLCQSQLEDGVYNTSQNRKSAMGSATGTSTGALPLKPPHPQPPLTRDKRTKSAKERPKVKAQQQCRTTINSFSSFMTWQTSDPAVNAASSSSHIEDLNLLPSSTQSGKNAKQVPDLDNGFLLQVMQYTRQRIPTLNEYCVVCDEPHVFQNGAMLKPAVCARELCVFGFQTLGVMSDAAEDIATGAEVVDLLIAMAVAACRSHRREVIFEPYPTVVDPNQTELALNPKKKDYKRCETAMEGFMEMKEMMSLVGSDLKKGMDTIDVLSYPLLQWIITSNRSHVVKLPFQKQISFMRTPHQFLLMSSPPAKEAVFRAARQQHGSTFAFHGSHIENWHSIMRLGLINATGTKHQMHGAAYGKGIYLSPHASVSFGYSGMGYGHYKAHKGSKVDGKGSSRFLNSKNLTCIALCEVITHDLHKHGNIWVQPNADFCCTRFFFVYEDGQVGDSNIDTQVEKYQREIMHAVGYVTR